jgi:hypothetical protein
MQNIAGMQGIPIAAIPGMQNIPGIQAMQGIPGIQTIQGIPGIQGMQGIQMANLGQMGGMMPQFMMAQPGAAQMMQRMGQPQNFNMTDKRKK